MKKTRRERTCRTAPPGYHREWATHTAHCHGFANLSKARGVYVVYSPEFEGLGHQWILQIYPDGDRHAAEGMTSLFLWNMSDKAIDVMVLVSMMEMESKWQLDDLPHREIFLLPAA